MLVSKDVVGINPHFSFRCDIVEIEQADPETMDSIGELKHLLSLSGAIFLKIAACTTATASWSISFCAGTIWKTESWWSITG